MNPPNEPIPVSGENLSVNSVTFDKLTLGPSITMVGAVSPWSNPGHWQLPDQPPNRWRRFWTWLLLGWTWKRVD
jgi:hypothetical protein